MLKKTVVAAASAAMIAASSFVFAPPAAAATSGSVSVSIRGPHFSISIGHRPPVVYPQPYRVCKPVYKRVYYKYRGKTYSKLVKTGVRCYWVYPKPAYPRYPYHPY